MLDLEEGGDEAKGVEGWLLEPGVHRFFGCVAHKDGAETVVELQVWLSADNVDGL